MTRRQMLASTMGAAVLGSCGTERGSSRRPPNILYLMTDQQKASACSAYGNRAVPSPFMDRMAKEGIVFRDAYAASTICSPSRCSVFTGVHPLVHRLTCHQNRAPYNLVQLPELLSQQGYYTAAFGHYEGERDITRGWHNQVPTDQQGVIKAALTDWYSEGRHDVGWSSGRQKRSPERAHAAVITDRVVDSLDAMKKMNQPFFLHVPYLEPHPPYFAPAPFDTMVDFHKLDVPSRGGPGSPKWQEAVREQQGTAKATDDDIRKMLATVYGMIAYADSQMNRLYQEMGRRGLLENTWVIISADHGDYGGEKGMFMKSESLYECLLHVPLIVRPPEASSWTRGSVVEGLVNTTDLFPTILGLAGAKTPDYTQGKDLVSWVNTTNRQPLHDAVFAQVGDYHGGLGTTNPSGLPAAGRHRSLLEGARTLTHSFVKDPDYGDEAYDLRADPKELTTLLNASGAAEPAEISALRRRVDAWHEESVRLRDKLGVIPGYRGFEEGQ